MTENPNPESNQPTPGTVPPGPKPKAKRPGPFNDPRYPRGVTVTFGERGERMGRFCSPAEALKQAATQRLGREPLRVWDGDSYKREGSKPLLEVEQGKEIPTEPARR